MFSQSKASDLTPITCSVVELTHKLQQVIQGSVSDLRRVHVDVLTLPVEGPPQVRDTLNSLEELAELSGFDPQDDVLMDVHAWKAGEIDVFLSISLKSRRESLEVEVASYDTVCEHAVLAQLLEWFPPKAGAQAAEVEEVVQEAIQEKAEASAQAAVLDAAPLPTPAPPPVPTPQEAGPVAVETVSEPAPLPLKEPVRAVPMAAASAIATKQALEDMFESPVHPELILDTPAYREPPVVVAPVAPAQSVAPLAPKSAPKPQGAPPARQGRKILLVVLLLLLLLGAAVAAFMVFKKSSSESALNSPPASAPSAAPVNVDPAPGVAPEPTPAPTSEPQPTSVSAAPVSTAANTPAPAVAPESTPTPASQTQPVSVAPAPAPAAQAPAANLPAERTVDGNYPAKDPYVPPKP